MMSDSDDKEASEPPVSTTTISTIAVQSGPTRIIIALLQVKDWLELKVLEVTPCLTQLGETLHEAQALRESHYDVIKKIQSKKSPVDELLREADEAVAKQEAGPKSVNNRPEVYAAMAESLTAVWNNINAHLHTRKRILDLNLDYHRCAEVYEEKCDGIERACKAGLPIEIEEMRYCLDSLKEMNREMLLALNGALHIGSSLVQVLGEIKEEGTLDSRPGQIKFRAQLAKYQVEKWMEGLHERRGEVTILWDARKKEIEECLGLTLITADLAMLHHLLADRTESLLRSTDQLGDAHASAQLLLHEHRKLLPEAKDLQEQALKIVKANEEFALGGHFAGPEAISKAYQLLEEAATYLHHIDQRESSLCRSIEFFDQAHSALIKLDQLEVQLKTGDLGLNMAQLEQLHSNVARSLEEVTAQPLQLGYSLVQDVPGAEGVKRMVEQIENKKINLSVQCTAHKEENVKANRLYTNFIEKYEQLFTWLTNMEAYLSGVRDMGINLNTATDFLQIYRKNLNDIQVKGSEINALISTISSTIQFLDEKRSAEIKEKGETLSRKWNELNSELEMRTELGAIYVKAHDLFSKLFSELDSIEAVIKAGDDGDETLAKQCWVTCQQLEPQLNNTASKFNHESKKVASALDGEGARLCLETKCEQLVSRRLCLEADWNLWLQEREARQQARLQWDTNMAASSKTVDWVTKLDAQLYPVLNEDLHSALQLARNVEDKMSIVLPEIKKAQKEIQLRIETVEDLVSKGGIQGYNEGIPLRLKELNNRLLGISTEYQILLEKLLTFFNSLSQVESRIEAVQMDEKMSTAPLNLTEAERMCREFEATKQTITEMLNLCLIESGHIIAKIKSQETNSQNDIRTVERAVETLRYNWQRTMTGRERNLEKYLRRCQFDYDLIEIYKSFEQLSEKLEHMKGQYGDNIASAQACSVSFSSFEQIIKVLEDRIVRFIDSGEEMVGSDAGEHIERELTSLRQKWQLLKNQISETRQLIDISIQYFILVEEAEYWFREGNRLLVTIASRLTHVNSVDDATELLNEIETFLKPGEEKQYERINCITKLGEQLQKKGNFPQMIRVQEENKEMLESFSQVSLNLKALCEKLQKPPEAIVKEPVIEPMETEDKVDLVIDLRKTRHETEEIISTSIIHKIEIERDETLKLEPEPQNEEKEERQKSPSPPLKKVKYLDELPVTQEPYFTVPLQDATVEEGNRFTFECRVIGMPLPEVVWEKDGISIENNPDYQTKFDQGICSLTIEETFAEDSARFVCRASNSAGSVETSAVLTVKESEPVEEASPPVFVTPLSAVSVTEGGRLELKCLVDGVPLPTVQWFMGSRCLDNDPAYFISFNNGNALLVKGTATPDDHGSYSCIATNPLGTETSVAKVNIDRKETCEVPTFTLELGNVMARAGQKIKLECEAKGTPNPELSWTHDGKSIKENRDIKITSECGKTTLVINEAFPKDAGVYTVTATNTAGSVSTTSQVMVKGRLPAETSDSELPSDMESIKPSVQLPLRDQSVFEGKKVRLDCVIVGHPEPEVIWYHNDRPVKESSDIQLTFQGDRCSLIIREAFLEDAGTYKVVAINSAGEASSWCMLNVQAIDKSTEHATRHPVEQFPVETSVEGKPKFIKMPTDGLATQGDTVTFECVVSGIPTPTVSWALNNVDIQQSDRTHMTQDSEGNCSLKITGVLPEDKGVYTAKATNQQGEVKCFAQLIVKTPVTLESKPSPQPEEKLMSPSFSELFADRTVPEGQSTKFECIVTGKPMPKIRWLFNDEPVSGKDFLVSTSGNRQVLSLPKVTRAQAGKIACVAENEAGKSSCVAKLTVSEPSLISLLPSLDNIGLQETQDGSVFEMKRAVFMQSSSSSHYSSVTGVGSQPVVQMQSMSSKSEMASQKFGDQPTVQVESHRTSEYSNIGGIESRHESETMKSSGDMLPPKLMKPQRKSMPPRFISPLNGCIVDQGADVTLEAIIEGYPMPTISWTKNGTPCSMDLETSWEFGKARLKLLNVKTSDGGRYSLTATNTAGTAVSTADVVVKKSSFPPVMGRRLQATSAYVGDRVVLEVEVTGTPSPTVTWQKNDQLIPQVTANSRLQSFGNSHSLIIEKACLSDSGKYSVLATNCAGESRSTADLFISEKPQDQLPPTSSVHFQSFLDRSVLQDLGPFKIPPMSSTITPQKESVVVSESFKSEKQVSMKVQHSSQSVDIQMPSWENKGQLTFSCETAETTKDEKKDDSVVEDSITKKSALDFFKNIIKENEDESKKKEALETSRPIELLFTSHSPVESSVYQEFESVKLSEKINSDSQNAPSKTDVSQFILEPEPPPEMGFVPKGTVSKPREEMADRVKKLEETTRRLSETEVPLGGVKIFPTPPPKKESPPRDKKMFESSEYSSKKEIVEEVIQPTKVEPVGIGDWTFRQLETLDSTPAPILRPSANIDVRPVSPRPSAEGISMEKLWTSHPKEDSTDQPIAPTSIHEESHKSFESKFETSVSHQSVIKSVQPPVWKPVSLPPLPSVSQISVLDRPKSPGPSADGLAMDKLWGHKHSESSLSKTVWPPPESSIVPTAQTSAVTSEFIQKAHSSESHVRESFASTSVQESVKEQKTFHETIGQKINQPEIKPTDKIIYVAEAHASHSSNLIDRQQIISHMSTSSDFQQASSREETKVVEEKTLKPSEAKKIWPQGLPLEIEKKTKPKQEPKPQPVRSQSVQDPQLDDINIEPGPPPEIGFATPTHVERRQSYVEIIEQGLQKDLEKEPSKHLVGAVRTIPPPPKKEKSVEPQVQKTTSQFEATQSQEIKSTFTTSENSSFKPFPQLEPFPFKPEPVRTQPAKFNTIPRPSKFVKKSFTESDYESEVEGNKIKTRWTPWDSDTEELLTYRKVQPPAFAVQPKRAHSVEPTPPSQHPPLYYTSRTTACFTSTFDRQTRKKFETQMKTVKTKSESTDISLKPGSPPMFLQAQPKKVESKPDSPKSKKRAPAMDSGYMADTDEPQKFMKHTRSTTSQSNISSQVTRSEKHIIQSSKLEKKSSMSARSMEKKETSVPKLVTQELEPFPFKPEPSVCPTKRSIPPPPSPSKFVKGDFKESDYESDYEGRIKPIWRPLCGDGEDPSFRPVRPVLTPAPTPSQKQREPTPPSEFDQPPNLSGPMRPKFQPIDKPHTPVKLTDIVQVSADKKLVKPLPVQTTPYPPRDDFNLKPGSPPKMDFAPPPLGYKNAVETSNSMSFTESTESSRRVVSVQQTTRLISFDHTGKKVIERQTSLPSKFVQKGDAKWVTDSESEASKKELSELDIKAEQRRLKRVEEMRKRFGEKTSQSVADLKPGEPPKFDYAPPRIPAPAAIVADKHISEMTSAFKTKTQQFATDIMKDVKQNGQKETMKDEPQAYREESRIAEYGTKHIDPDTGLIYFKYDFGYEFGVVMPGEGTKQSKEKRPLIKGESDRDKEGSIVVPVIHETTVKGTKKKTVASQLVKSVKWDPTSESEFSEAEDTLGKKRIHQQPRIMIPSAATPSPQSLSPSLPSLSPYYTSQGHDNTVTGHQWASGTSSPCSYSQTPPVVNASIHGDLPKKPPLFITPLKDIAVVNGRLARFECIVQAEPTPNIIWAKNGRIIEPSANHHIEFRNGVCRLTLPQAFQYDAGTYSCTATNLLGTQETKATLQVSGEGRTYISK